MDLQKPTSNIEVRAYTLIQVCYRKVEELTEILKPVLLESAPTDTSNVAAVECPLNSRLASLVDSLEALQKRIVI